MSKPLKIGRKWRAAPTTWLGDVRFIETFPSSSLHLEDDCSCDYEAFAQEKSHYVTPLVDMDLRKIEHLRVKKSSKQVKPHRAARSGDHFFKVAPSHGKKVFIHHRKQKILSQGQHPKRSLPQANRPTTYAPSHGNHYLTPTDTGDLDVSLAELMLQIQEREITEDDYELLLQLDIANNNGSAQVRQRAGALRRWQSVSVDESLVAKESCVVCMSHFDRDERVKTLLCGHTFHSECLNQWTQRFASTCPLDNRNIFDMRPEQCGRVSEVTKPARIYRVQ